MQLHRDASTFRAPPGAAGLASNTQVLSIAFEVKNYNYDNLAESCNSLPTTLTTTHKPDEAELAEIVFSRIPELKLLATEAEKAQRVVGFLRNTTTSAAALAAAPEQTISSGGGTAIDPVANYCLVDAAVAAAVGKAIAEIIDGGRSWTASAAKRIDANLASQARDLPLKSVTPVAEVPTMQPLVHIDVKLAAGDKRRVLHSNENGRLTRVVVEVSSGNLSAAGYDPAQKEALEAMQAIEYSAKGALATRLASALTDATGLAADVQGVDVKGSMLTVFSMFACSVHLSTLVARYERSYTQDFVPTALYNDCTIDIVAVSFGGADARSQRDKERCQTFTKEFAMGWSPGHGNRKAAISNFCAAVCKARSAGGWRTAATASCRS